MHENFLLSSEALSADKDNLPVLELFSQDLPELKLQLMVHPAVQQVAAIASQNGNSLWGYLESCMAIFVGRNLIWIDFPVLFFFFFFFWPVVVFGRIREVDPFLFSDRLAHRGINFMAVPLTSLPVRQPEQHNPGLDLS